MPIKRITQLLHRWLGLLLGAQVLLWALSGVIMSWFPIELVHGETATLEDYPLSLDARSYASPGGIIAQMKDVKEITLKRRFKKTIYEVKSADELAIFNADTGQKLSPIDEKFVRDIAKKDFVGVADIGKVTLLFDAPQEYRGPLPVWRVDFHDENKTRLYISQSTGEVIARRNKIWRLYDFFWMLHIMDYDERKDFNNPLIKAASATGLLFTLSGLILIGTRLASGRYKQDIIRKR